MDIRRNENVLIVCDPTTAEVGAALHEAAMTRSDRVLLMLMPKGRHHGQEPPAPVATLMRQQQVVIAPTRYSLTHTRAVRTALSDGARIVTMPGMTAEMFQGGGMSADFTTVKQSIARLPSRLRRRRIVNVRSEHGTELTFEVAWREWNFDDNGICNRPKMVMNLPAGKVFIMPREGTMNGRLVMDGSWEGTMIEEPVTLEIEQGVIASITGGEMASRIRKEFQDAAEPLRPKDQDVAGTVAEFGFGMNPAAALTGSVLEDEKCLGTCYFMFGDNTAGGGSNRVGFTLSGVMRNPSIWLDDERLLENGQFAED
jgi:leucyl aminopeptidase (aminopeptidase T)